MKNINNMLYAFKYSITWLIGAILIIVVFLVLHKYNVDVNAYRFKTLMLILWTSLQVINYIIKVK